MSGLNWRTMRGERHPQFLVKGTELACAHYGDHGRFMLVEYRVLAGGEFPGSDRRVRVRDAHKVSDADLREGKRSPIVADFADENAAMAWCDEQSV